MGRTTYAYLAPEGLDLGRKPTEGAPMDVWAAGMVLLELVHRRHECGPLSPRGTGQDILDELVSDTCHCLQSRACLRSIDWAHKTECVWLRQPCSPDLIEMSALWPTHLHHR